MNRQDVDPLDLVNTSLLPPNLRKLCRAVGSRKAFRLCEERGGVPLQVPNRALLDHWLVDIIGFDGLQALVQELKGELIDVPKYDKVMMQLKHQQAHACLKAGLGLTRTALKIGYTKRHILNIQADLQMAMGERYQFPDQVDVQQDLFGGLDDGEGACNDLHDFDEMEAQAVAEQDGGVVSIDDEHRDTALAAENGAHNPFGIGRSPR